MNAGDAFKDGLKRVSTMTRNPDPDPWQALALAILSRAKRDAARGDLGALAWLIVAGVDIAEDVRPGAGDVILSFARGCMQEVETEKIIAHWRTT